MNEKVSDYAKVVRVIASCCTSRQNNVAYRMINFFEKKHGRGLFANALYEQCDSNLMDILK